ncbi:hypothetical protein FACS1894217_10070 [Clostridia bacterium]|nr:hypothetical protein FACS1894217_10070 [Clostridia bacterium]
MTGFKFKRFAVMAVVAALMLPILAACSQDKVTPTPPPYSPGGTFTVRMSGPSHKALRADLLFQLAEVPEESSGGSGHGEAAADDTPSIEQGIIRDAIIKELAKLDESQVIAPALDLDALSAKILEAVNTALGKEEFAKCWFLNFQPG